MQIKGPSNPVRLQLEQLKTDLVRQLRPGQTLKATVLSENQNGLVKLALGNTTVTAQTALKLAPGSMIQLEVVRTGQQPELRALLPASTQAVQAQALRSALPKAQPLPQVFEQLQQALGRADLAALPRPVQQALAQVLGSVAGYQTLSDPGGLSRLLGSSGLLFEATLAKGSPSAGDVKSTLLRLLSLIQSASETPVPARGQPGSAASSPTADTLQPRLLGALLTLAESALARIELNQLASLPGNNAGQPMWQFELPVQTDKGFDSVWVQIDQDAGHEPNRGEADGWNVNLQLDLSNLGRMRAGIHLQGETVRASFVAEKVETTLLLNQNLDTLRRGLNRAGLDVTTLEVHQGVVTPP